MEHTFPNVKKSGKTSKFNLTHALTVHYNSISLLQLWLHATAIRRLKEENTWIWVTLLINVPSYFVRTRLFFHLII